MIAEAESLPNLTFDLGYLCVYADNDYWVANNIKMGPRQFGTNIKYGTDNVTGARVFQFNANDQNNTYKNNAHVKPYSLPVAYWQRFQ